MQAPTGREAGRQGSRRWLAGKASNFEWHAIRQAGAGWHKSGRRWLAGRQALTGRRSGWWCPVWREADRQPDKQTEWQADKQAGRQVEVTQANGFLVCRRAGGRAGGLHLYAHPTKDARDSFA
jgi:hypothetical protein